MYLYLYLYLANSQVPVPVPRYYRLYLTPTLLWGLNIIVTAVALASEIWRGAGKL